MKRKFLLSIAVFVFMAGAVSADTFGTGDNQFEIDFVTILGDTNPTSGYGIVNSDYRMGTYEITNDQIAKFAANNPYWMNADVPANMLTWAEGAQFVNYLNTSTGYQAAYKLTNTGDFTVWEIGDAGYDSTNPYRNSNAYYFLPTEDEWVKAAYWNGTNLQTHASVGDVVPTQGSWNFYDNGYATTPPGPWNVGSGSEELNGTYDMMGNVWERMESPSSLVRGGSFGSTYNTSSD